MAPPRPSEQRAAAPGSASSRPRWHAAGLVLATFALLAGLIAASQALAAPDETVLVSRASGADGAKGNAESLDASVSADGRFVAFASSATNLNPDAADLVQDIFVRDLVQNTTTLASRAAGVDGESGDRHSYQPSISADGRFVAFASRATNLHPDDTDATSDVFVRDLEQSTTTLASRASGAGGEKGSGESARFDGPSISADGRFVAFHSLATNLHPDAAGFAFPGHLFVRDLEQSTTIVASRATGADGATDAGASPSISADGRFVAFFSIGRRLHPDATGGQIFVRDLEQNTTAIASRSSSADGEPGGGSPTPSISADGRFVAFASSGRLHPDATDRRHVFVRDLQQSTTTLASRAWGPAGAPANEASGDPSISADGRLVAFASSATNLHPDAANDPRGGFLRDVFVRDLEQSTTMLASQPSGADGEAGGSFDPGPSISADGRFVAFDSPASNLHPDATDRLPDVFRRQLPATPPPRPVEENLPARLEIERARIVRRENGSRLLIRGSLDPEATGEAVVVSFRARGHRTERDLRVGTDGRFGGTVFLFGPHRRVRAGRLAVGFPGDWTLRATSEGLRAARRAVRLRVHRVRHRGERLIVAGRVRPRARRQVRIRIEFNRPNGAPAEIAVRARVDDRGRFRVRRGVPSAVRNLGAHVSVTHPGRGRFHGQRRGRDVGGS